MLIIAMCCGMGTAAILRLESLKHVEAVSLLAQLRSQKEDLHVWLRSASN
jgi:hypothetical protein